MEVRTYDSDRQAIRVCFTYKGVQCKETLKNLPVNKRNKKYAESLVNRINAEITTGEFVYSKYFPRSKLGRKLSGGPSYANLADIKNDYEAECKKKYQPATVKTYMQPLNSWWLPRIGKKPMAEIDANLIRSELKAMTQSHKTISVYKTAINRLLDWCVEENYIKANPALSVSVGRTVGQQKRVSTAVDPLTQDEMKAALAACDGFYQRYLTFALYTGLRPSELYGLKWADVDLRSGSVYIHQAIVHGELKGIPKTDAGLRDVELRPQALEALKAQQKATRFREHGYVWENPITHKPLRRYKETGGRWARVLKKAGVRHRRQYQTRHTYASHLLSGGENPHFVASQMGHATVEITYRHYARWIKQAEKYDWKSDYGDLR